MTSWTANDLPDQTGRTVVITGAGRGLGLIAAREFARVGARVVLGVRDEGKAREAVAGLPGTFVIRPLDVSDLTSVRAFPGMRAYQASKLAAVLFSLELQRRLTAAGSPVRSVLASPGIARTTLAAHSRSNVINRFTFLTNAPERGALSLLYAATQDVPGNSYIGPDGLGGFRGFPVLRRQGKAGLDAAMAGRLWDATAGLVGSVTR